jgi:PAS domain S-box-containing protein
MKINIPKKLFLFALVVLTGNGLLGYAVYESNQKRMYAEQRVQHTEQMIYQSGNILSMAKDIESASRGFVITNDSTFLEPLNTAKKTVFVSIRQLRQLANDNPAQQRRIDSLNFYIRKRLDFSNKIIELRSKQGLTSAVGYTSAKQGKHYTDRIRQITYAIQQEENTLLKQRKQTNERIDTAFKQFSQVMFISLAGFTVLLLIVVGKYLYQIKEKGKRGAELAIANEELLYQNEEKGKRAAELVVANQELSCQNREKEKRAAELAIANKELSFQNEEKEKRAAELNKAKDLYAFISQVNQYIAHTKDEKALFKNACGIALEFGKFKIAWIGMFGNANKTITNIDQIGISAAGINKFKEEPLEANGPQEYVLHTGGHYICNDIMNDPELESWKPFAIQQGVCSCMILPIEKAGNVIGTFNLYAAEVNFFNKEEIALLLEVTRDISFALDLFEKEHTHRQTLELVIQNEKRFHALIEKSADMITLSNEDGELIYISDSITKGLGYSVNDLLFSSVFDIIHPDDLPGTIENKNRIVQFPGDSFYYQQRRLHKNGNWIWCEGSLTNMLHEPGINALVSNFRDISEKKMMEQRQEFDKNNMDALINNTNDLMWSVDKDFKMITSNQPFDDMMKLTSGKAVEKGGDILGVAYSVEESKRYKKSYEKAFSGESFTEVVNNESLVDIWSEISYCPIRKGDEVIGTACHSHDITERKRSDETLKQAQENLKYSESSLKEAQNIANIGSFEIDIVNYAEIWSDQMYKILGVEKKLTPSNELFSSFIHPDDLDAAREAFKSNQDASMDYRLIRKDGLLRYVNSEWRFEFNENNKPIRLYGILQDITERKLAEIERTKMVNDMILRNTELEQFSYIISHNLRAPVANIIGAADALNDPDLSIEDKETLNKGINISVIKLDNVVKDLNHILEVKGEINDTKEIVHFSTLADDIKSSIQSIIDKHGVEIKYDFSEINEFLTLRAYLYSIFYNLISNSIKYRRQDVPCMIEIKSTLKKNKLELIFTDNGMGIDLKKNGGDIFGLYKRFHTNIEGKGMGLFMVKTQVETLGGKINIKSMENIGTEFKIEFEI